MRWSRWSFPITQSGSAPRTRGGGSRLVRVVSLAVVVPLIVAVLADAPAGADGGGGAPPLPPTACYTSDSVFRQVIFPVGGMAYPEAHQLTTEYEGQGIVFSDDDSDLAPAYKKLNPAPESYNVVRQSTLGSFYRMNFVGNDVFRVQLTLDDSNAAYTVNKLAAFSANGTLLASTRYADGQNGSTDRPYFLRVQSTGEPIKSIVFTQEDLTGARVDMSMVLRCVEFGTPRPAPPPPPPPPPAEQCPTRTVTANADAWFEQGSTSNKGDDSSLVVQSKSGQAFRALARFPLPSLPAGCVVDTAELRLYADSFASGRTIQAQRVAGAWSEMGVTWTNQPATTGPSASSSSGSSKGWRTWAVGPQVADMYATGAAHGFLIRDAAEGNDAKQVYFSREKGQNVPTLVIKYRAGSPPEPSPEPEPKPEPTPTPPPNCGSATVTSNADAWFEQGSTSNKGDDSSLVVQSKPGQAFRAMVRFPLPAVPAGCVYDSAELRLYADGVTAGRTIEAQRIANPWSELEDTWDSQPAGAGAVASTSSGSDKGWNTWAVGPQVGEMYAAGAANGFVIRDANEGNDAKQVYFSREKGQSPPTLEVKFRSP